MAKAIVYNQKGDKKGDVTLNKEIFDIEMNEQLLKRVIQYQMNNARKPIAHVKTRGDVSGGGRKPFRQKGTGSARQGSSRNPVLRGGGVVFGPKNTRNFAEMMPKKQRRKALFVALSSKAKDGKILVLDKYEGGVKTKEFNALIKKLPIERNVLIVIPEKSNVIQMSSSNIPNVKTIQANYLNAFDIMKYKNLLFLEGALKKAEEVFLQAKKKEEK